MLFFLRYLRSSVNHFGLFYFIFANMQLYYVGFHNLYLRFYLSRLCDVFKTPLCYHVASSQFILTQFATWECLFFAIFFLLTKKHNPRRITRVSRAHYFMVSPWQKCSFSFPTYPFLPKLPNFTCEGGASKWECIIINSLIKFNVMQASKWTVISKQLWLVKCYD